MNLQKSENPEIVKPLFLPAYVAVHRADAPKRMPTLYYLWLLIIGFI
jgi:hypothetical protein